MLTKSLIRGVRSYAERRTPGRPPGEARTVLAIELTRMGDVISALPTIHALPAALPGAQVHVLVDERYASLLAGSRPWMVIHGIHKPASVRGLIAAVRFGRRVRAGIAISLSPANRNGITALLSGSPVIAGYLRPTSSHTPFLHENPVESIGSVLQADVSYGKENLYSRAPKILAALGLRFNPGAGPLFPETDPAAYDDAPGGKPYVVIHPFAAWKYRAWGVPNFLALIDLMLQSLPHDIVVVCAPEEENQIAPMRARCESSGRVRFFQSPHLPDVAAVLRGADLFVGNDSGPLHLAVAAGVPVVGVYGPAAPILTAPPGARAIYLYAGVHCAPCEQRRCPVPNTPCMSSHSPESVFRAVTRSLLRGRSGAHAAQA